MDEILIDLLNYLENNHKFDNPKDFHYDFIKEAENAADKYITINEIEGSMASLEYNGYLIIYYYETIKALSEDYLSVTLPSYDEYSSTE